uniref:Transposase n=1 Tax=Heterorhabditis bacteriophora TaxID=37862 RepID=A0A1I7WR24_HETBA
MCEDLSAGAFLKCLQRFVALRGVPKIIRSD